jgi:uncharacterized membrane protein YkoI
MKIVLTTTTIVALLALGIVGLNNNSNGINNAYAQEGAITPEGMNNTMSMENNTGMMGMEKDDDMMMKVNGTINVEGTIAEAFKSKITTDIIGAIQAAQTSVGANSFVKEAELTHAHGFLVYKLKVVDENLKKYKVIVDPGNGQVLLKKEITWCEGDYDHKKMEYGDHDKYSNHGYDDDYDQKKLMEKDKKY